MWCCKLGVWSTGKVMLMQIVFCARKRNTWYVACRLLVDLNCCIVHFFVLFGANKKGIVMAQQLLPACWVDGCGKIGELESQRCACGLNFEKLRETPTHPTTVAPRSSQLENQLLCVTHNICISKILIWPLNLMLRGIQLPWSFEKEFVWCWL
jgi:hypothetical protein